MLNINMFWLKKGENKIKIIKGTKVKICFQGLHMSFLCRFIIQNFVFWIPNLTLQIFFD
jgi:hypothetical protein